MKVKDVIRQLSTMDLNKEIFLKSIDPDVGNSKQMSSIRVYNWGKHVIIDGYEPVRATSAKDG